MKKILPFLLAMISGLLPILSLISTLPGWLILIGYIPLLYGESLLSQTTSKRNWKIFLMGFICFFITNIVSLYPFGKLLSYWIVIYCIYSALLSAGVFLLFSITKRKLGARIGYISWVVFTVALEFWTLNTSFSFPCLLNGVLFFGSGNTSLVQWYEYTGVLGGSVWILLCNVLLFVLIKNLIDSKHIKGNMKYGIAALVCVLLPMIISIVRYHTYQEKENPMEAVVVQPNIDPYTEKFVKGYDEQLDIMLALSKESITPQTEYVVFPETALDSNIWLNNIRENYMVRKIRDSLLVDYPRAKVIAGVDMMEYYVVHNGVPPTRTAKKVDEKIYYDFFNAAIQIDSDGEVEAYKKSKLVIGTEYVPFTQRFPQLEKWVIHLGGSTQSRGRQEKPSLLHSEAADVAVVICFESIYGGYVSEFVRLGGEAIFVVSNDGWWDENPIPLRHFKYSQLRAIENRRSVIRSANTGLSGFINQQGDIIEISDWWEPVSMRQQVNKNTELTFYSRHGDYVGWICAGLSAVIILLFLYRILNNRRKRQTTVSSKKK